MPPPHPSVMGQTEGKPLWFLPSKGEGGEEGQRKSWQEKLGEGSLE